MKKPKMKKSNALVRVERFNKQIANGIKKIDESKFYSKEDLLRILIALPKEIEGLWFLSGITKNGSPTVEILPFVYKNSKSNKDPKIYIDKKGIKGLLELFVPENNKIILSNNELDIDNNTTLGQPKSSKPS